MKAFRTETDSMGEMQVPADALYGAQTARALENFPISGLRFPREFLRALGLIKKHAALTNVAQCKSYLEQSLGLCTALAPVIGYDQAARIAKVAHETRRTVREVALELSGVDKADLEALLDPARQTEPGLMGAGTGGAERVIHGPVRAVSPTLPAPPNRCTERPMRLYENHPAIPQPQRPSHLASSGRGTTPTPA